MAKDRWWRIMTTGASAVSAPDVLIFSIKNRRCLMEEDQVRNKENRNSHMRQWKVFSGVQRKNERRRKIKGDIFNIFA
ncbi:hypothetical protein [Angelakisella massiliensis]|uniref:hypothetical protein n=1 Tax=Angelakisella massiliensis TaxID=1871018 RepID=UPI0024B0DE4A|nr:hypothetical protein [Angelakisella massiliensis]